MLLSQHDVDDHPKQRALDALNPDVSIEDAIERPLFVAKIEKGIADADAGRTVPHDEVVKRMRKRMSP